MPIFEYVCTECSAKIEILLLDGQNAPTRCGYRCTLPAYDNRDIRGFGTLTKCASIFSSQNGSALRDKPSVAEIEKAGFALYQNEGDGVVRKVAGSGPNKIDTKEKPS